MISSVRTQAVAQSTRVQAGAMKFFEESTGDTAMVPGLEDSYEDLAADFLEGWLTSKPSFEVEPTVAEQSVSAPKTESKPADSTPLYEPAPQNFTSFHLGQEWNIA